MSDSAGDKTEKPTGKRLEEAITKGQIARSPEVQTVFVLGAAMMALSWTGREMWRTMSLSVRSSLGHLHDTDVTLDAMQGHAITGALTLGHCVWPVMLATVVGGILAGGIQTRFRATPEAINFSFDKLNPVQGFKRIFSTRAGVATGLGVLKLSVIVALCYSVIQSILNDPIFFTSINVERIAAFMADSSFKIVTRVGFALFVLAGADYGYRYWQQGEDLKMTKQEVKDEAKSSEGDPTMKGRIRRRRMTMSKRKMLAQVPKADVIVTNPTHIAIALRYDRKTMKAPKIVAKGIRFNALQIRQIAAEHQVPIVENKPLARLMFKYGKVDGEIPAQLYAAVAEILAWVYRVNAYRYYREQNM